MLKRLLIANRGEIARRVIRTARRMGVETVAVFSDADAKAPHVREADAAVRLGPPPARESYLDIAKVIAAARDSGADSVHPGYGFLSENADFAEAVEAAGLVWVGPPPSAIRSMGPKDEAKRIMQAAGVPTTPGWQGDDQSAANLAARAAEVGFPVLIKAVAGGGGKGMRRVDRAEDFAEALASAQREGKASFGDDRVLIERYAQRPRHIEVQVFADAHGNVVHLFERDCSLQRRHQKVIEEAPAPGMTPEVRESVCASAVAAARAVGYRGAGTVEFIADASDGLRADRIWFMEMNTRLQVEHPVTEMITGLDLVEWQLRVAAGEPLPLRQEEIRIDGWAMEARLYAENPATGFLPSTGGLEVFRLPRESSRVRFTIGRQEHAGEPPGARVDAGVEAGDEITPNYDPMIAKLIAHAPTREAAAGRLAGMCRDVVVWPVKTNAWFLARLAEDADFQAGRVDTGFISDRMEALTSPPRPSFRDFALAASERLDAIAHPEFSVLDSGPTNRDVWASRPGGLFGFRLNSARRAVFALASDGQCFQADVEAADVGGGGTRWALRGPEHVVGTYTDGPNVCEIDADEGAPPPFQRRVDRGLVLGRDGAAFLFAEPTFGEGAGGGAASDGKLLAPMPGRVVQLAVVEGQRVAKGAPVVTLEAMKMEHAMPAPFDAVVAEVPVAVGQQVAEGALLVRLEKAEASAPALDAV